MGNSQIWLKPQPTHIDDNFEDFLTYLASRPQAADALYAESVRLLKQRVKMLLNDRFVTAIYKQEKNLETLKFNTRLCAAWLLTVTDASQQESKEVLLTLINNLICQAQRSTSEGVTTLSYKSIPTLIHLAIQLATHKFAATPAFSWDFITDYNLDFLINDVIKLSLPREADSFYEGMGTIIAQNGELKLATYAKHEYDQRYRRSTFCETPLLPSCGIKVSTEKGGPQIKDSEKDNIDVVEEFVDDVLTLCSKANAKSHRLKSYADGEKVPVEVVEVSPLQIQVRTIDPSYKTVEGPLVFDTSLQAFNRIYRLDFWTRAINVHDQFNVTINATDQTFSLADDFFEYLQGIKVGDCFDATNNKPNAPVKNYEFWTKGGFLVYVKDTVNEDELQANGRYAVIEITDCRSEPYKGSFYGKIVDYDVEERGFTRDTACPEMLRDFLDGISKVNIQTLQYERLSPSFVKELCSTLHILQSRETNPVLRYRILSVIRILCTIMEDAGGADYFQYISQYLKNLINFSNANCNEGEVIKDVHIPEALEGDATVKNGADVLKILACFAKDYAETNATLTPYIDGANETLRNISSLVQAYNRLNELLEAKTLRDIKKKLLTQLSVVVDGDSNLELAKNLESPFGDEDDMKEFKSSFFIAPKNAQEQRQHVNIFRGICAMMNNRGGVLYLGVNDNGIPIGLKGDLQELSRRKMGDSIDAYMRNINRMGEDWFGEKIWKYVTLKPDNEYNIVAINVEPYPYDVVYLKDKTTYLRKNNSSAPITNPSTIEDIRRQRQERLRKCDNKIIVLQDAIQNKRKVRLMNYRSSNSATTKNRIVEAFKIEDDNEYIQAYEKDCVKVFRISRADSITECKERWEHEDEHKPLDIDPFHMSGNTKIDIVLRLELPAKNALEETYPKLADCIKRDSTKGVKQTWTLTTYTYNLRPLMLFYLSNAKDVAIVDAKGLKEAAVEYVRECLGS